MNTHIAPQMMTPKQVYKTPVPALHMAALVRGLSNFN